MSMLGCKSVKTPIEQNHRLGEKSEGQLIDWGNYQQMVEKLIYLSLTRPNIAYAASMVSHFMHAPLRPHLEAAYWILRYSKAASDKVILFKKGKELKLEAYTNGD